MKSLSKISCALVLGVLANSLFSATAAAESTPANRDRLRFFTGMPKKPTDSLFSFTAEWRVDGGQVFRATGLSFLNANRVNSAAPDHVTKKLLTAIKDGMIQLDPQMRGINVSHTSEPPELTIANKAGYALTNIIVRDYTNQKLRFDLVDKTFSADQVQVAIDLVMAADVEYLDGFSSQRAKTATQGEIEISIDDQAPVLVKTDGKTPHQIELEIATALKGAHLAGTPLFAHIQHTDTRNIKAFDGSEIRLESLAAKAVTVEVRDPSLGVLTKFKYREDGASVNTAAQPSVWLGAIIALGLAGLSYFGYRKFRAKARQHR